MVCHCRQETDSSNPNIIYVDVSIKTVVSNESSSETQIGIMNITNAVATFNEEDSTADLVIPAEFTNSKGNASISTTFAFTVNPSIPFSSTKGILEAPDGTIVGTVRLDENLALSFYDNDGVLISSSEGL